MYIIYVLETCIYTTQINVFKTKKKSQLTDGLDSVLHHICNISAI